MRDRRIDAEWELLAGLAEANPDVLVAVRREQDQFYVAMKRSPAWIEESGTTRVETEHALRFVYPRHYPTLPIEAYFARAILHVNVDAKTGFVCLWQSYRPSQTIVDAVLIARSIMAWRTANWDPVHLMQEVSFSRDCASCVLEMPELVVPERCRVQTFRSRAGRQRLTEETVTDDTGTYGPSTKDTSANDTSGSDTRPNEPSASNTSTNDTSTSDIREPFCVF